MPGEMHPSFAFLVLTFNHQEYILEHLESIKYLVLNYGSDLKVDLIVNDDRSKDRTREIVDEWIKHNREIFRTVKTIYNKRNIGTCASIGNMLTHMVADRCKMTAGDDVYSFENIFELTVYSPNVGLLSGRVLHLLGDEVVDDRISNWLMTAADVIYQRDSLLHRFKHFSYNNAPNILYATDCLLDENVQGYMKRFDVTEDWPLQVAISRQYSSKVFRLINQVLVYYRRTAGSTYIVANQRFVNDKLRMYEDLIRHESRWIEIVRLYSRKLCFKMNNRWLNKALNIDFYCFGISCVLKIGKIAQRNKEVDMRVEEHRRHYARIQSAAADFAKRTGLLTTDSIVKE